MTVHRGICVYEPCHVGTELSSTHYLPSTTQNGLWLTGAQVHPVGSVITLGLGEHAYSLSLAQGKAGPAPRSAGSGMLESESPQVNWGTLKHVG